MNRLNMINYSDVSNLRNIYIDILSCTEYLRREASNDGLGNYTNNIYNSLRKLSIASLMYNRTLICISGLQGTGKTTLMKNFYGVGEEFWNISHGRSESLPILITEDDVKSPIMKSYSVVKERIESDIEESEKWEYKVSEKSLSCEEFIKASSGSEEVMYLELIVPYQHTYNKGVSFVLLPGFEKDEAYNNLIDFSVSSSDAAVFVFNATSFSDISNEAILSKIENRFRDNIIYAITGSDGASDGNEEVKRNCIKTMKIPSNKEDSVVCVGEYADQSKNEAWIKAFINAVNKYAIKPEARQEIVKKSNQYIYDELSIMQDNLMGILRLVDRNKLEIVDDYRDNSLIRAFDRAYNKKREELSNYLVEELGKARNESINFIETKYADTDWKKSLRQYILGESTKDVAEGKQVIADSLVSKDNRHIKNITTPTQDSPRKDASVDIRLYDPNVVYLPDIYVANAFRRTIRLFETTKNEISRLIKVEDNSGFKQIIPDDELSKSTIKDVCTLLSTDGTPQCLVSNNQKRVVEAIAETMLYYYGIVTYESIADKIQGIEPYNPDQMKYLNGQNFDDGCACAKKFTAGLAGVMGVDLVGDGSINFVSQIATSMGISTPVVGAAAVVLVTAGTAVSVWRDIVKMQRDQLTDAQNTVFSIYAGIKEDILKRLDNYAERVKDNIVRNLEELSSKKKMITNEYNVRLHVDRALDLIEKLKIENHPQQDGMGMS